ncbi:MAG: methyltransferase [Chloroflexi bacterium]|nr:methyltransferase [Chloroflexota bacterium]
MPIIPSALERLIFFGLNAGPGPLLDIFGGVAFRTVLAGVKLGVFDALHPRPLTAADLAARIDANERGVTVLLETLIALGYVAKKGDRYSNTAMTRKWLVSSSRSSIVHGYVYWGTILQELWVNLEESIRTGQPHTNLYEWLATRPDTARAFQQWMEAITRLNAGEILGKFKLQSGARRVIDIGGGHAMYSIALCQRYPQLTSVVIDAPEALTIAEETVAAVKLSHRITLRASNFLEDDLGEGYDVALLFNIVHGLHTAQNRLLVQRVADALRVGGQIAIVEQLADKAPGPTTRAIGHLLGLSYFHLLGGQVYTFDEVAEWLRAAGFVQLQRKNLLKSSSGNLILASKGDGTKGEAAS